MIYCQGETIAHFIITKLWSEPTNLDVSSTCEIIHSLEDPGLLSHSFDVIFNSPESHLSKKYVRLLFHSLVLHLYLYSSFIFSVLIDKTATKFRAKPIFYLNVDVEKFTWSEVETINVPSTQQFFHMFQLRKKRTLELLKRTTLT